ncbi:glycine--tRNA ligase subunit beta [Nocardia sp. NPDC049190]|uniref:glycine--tRNA ligase subunit beta n=1 Tax=Nocardia sp. NPDC049190 TaxID=3155650 RepID=UPI0033E2B433
MTNSLPASPAALLALADRFDLLVALLAHRRQVHQTSGTYGPRRAATGIVRILCAHPELQTSLTATALAAAARPDGTVDLMVFLAWFAGRSSSGRCRDDDTECRGEERG